MNPQILIYILSGAIILIIAWLAYLEIRLRRVFGGKRAGDLEEVLRAVAKEINELNSSREEIEKYLATVEARLRRAVQHVGMVRFNPFPDSGSDQSFALAVLDEKKNGIVISSLYGRGTSRIFAKPIEAGHSQHQLSQEEIQAIELALKS